MDANTGVSEAQALQAYEDYLRARIDDAQNSGDRHLAEDALYVLNDYRATQI